MIVKNGCTVCMMAAFANCLTVIIVERLQRVHCLCPCFLHAWIHMCLRCFDIWGKRLSVWLCKTCSNGIALPISQCWPGVMPWDASEANPLVWRSYEWLKSNIVTWTVWFWNNAGNSQTSINGRHATCFSTGSTGGETSQKGQSTLCKHCNLCSPTNTRWGT